MFVTAGFDELERKLQRAVDRLRVLLDRHKLTKAEINLGSLGWQQVDDFPPDIEEQMRAIDAWERQQTDLSNESAEIQSSIDELQAQRKENRTRLDDLLSELEPALQPLMETRNVLEKSVPAGNESIQRFDRAIADLEVAHENFGKRIRELMVQPETAQVRDQIFWMEERRTSLENEKEDLMRSRMKVSTDLKTVAQRIQSTRGQIDELNQKTRAAKEESNAKERELLSQIDGMEKQKQDASKHVEHLDQKKSSAYLAIGRCLADSEIAPMNQPEALDRVIVLRGEVFRLLEQIETSLARSAQVPAATMMTFYASALIFFAVIIIAAIYLLHRHPAH